MSQHINLVDRNKAIDIVLRQATHFRGLDFGACSALHIVELLGQLPAKAENQVDLSSVCRVLQYGHTAKLLGSANRGLRRAQTEIVRMRQRWDPAVIKQLRSA